MNENRWVMRTEWKYANNSSQNLANKCQNQLFELTVVFDEPNRRETNITSIYWRSKEAIRLRVM